VSIEPGTSTGNWRAWQGWPDSIGEAATRRFDRELFELIAPLVPQGGQVMEAGGSRGRHGPGLASFEGLRLTLLNPTEEEAALARKQLESQGCNAEVCVAEKLEGSSPRFDLVLNAGALEAPDFQANVSLLKALASHSSHWVLVLVPNLRCPWYWLPRLKDAEALPAPAPTDLTSLFEAAGLHFLGQRFVGADLTEGLLDSLSGFDEPTRQALLRLHGLARAAPEQRSLLLAGLGCREPLELPREAHGWKRSCPAPTCGDEAQQQLGAAEAEIARAMGELDQFRVSRAYKLGRYLGQLRRDAKGTAATSLRWLTGEYRRKGIGLIGALEAEDPLQLVADRLHAASAAVKTEGGAAESSFSSRPSLPLEDLAPCRKGRVSVVLPVYNQASMLAEAIESVLAQTYRDIELIIVNDGSSDGVEKVLDRYVDDPRVVVLTQPNRKLPAALNEGFRHATGELYTWTSADNAMLPDQLERMVAWLKSHPEQAMVFSDYQAIDDAGKPLHDPKFRPQNQDPSDPAVMRLPNEVTVANFHESGDNFIGASFLYRR
jgi:hypothetical protein